MSVNLPESDVWGRYALLTCDEMRRAEALSCASGEHNFWDLMQRAGQAVAQAVLDNYPKGQVLVLCGTGNNGGDGYVAAQALLEAGWPVRAVALGPSTTVDAQKAESAWRGETLPYEEPFLEDTDLVIDALFGTGLTRPLEGLAARMVDEVTARGLPVVAADMPSGINGDTGEVMGSAFMAELTVTFWRKKRGHVLFPAAKYCGEVLIADTGMKDDVISEINATTYENNIDLWHSFKQTHEVTDHKYLRGHVLVFGGTVLTGASRLASRAAQRIGAGLVTLACPQSAWEVYAKSLESVMVRALKTTSNALELIDNPKINAILIGPGLGLEEEHKTLVKAVLASRKPCVLDADALMLFEGESDLLADLLHEKCVLTPHEGEFHRLFDGFVEKKADKISKTTDVAAKMGCVVLQKGADTVIAEPSGRMVVNANAPPWLATAGSGDVLAGMIAGSMASGMAPFAAAGYAAHIHGAAAQVFGPGLIAEDLIETIPAVLQSYL